MRVETLSFTLQLQRYLDAGTGITSSSGIESSKPRSSRGRKRSKKLEELRRREQRRRTGAGQKEATEAQWRVGCSEGRSRPTTAAPAEPGYAGEPLKVKQDLFY